MTKSFYIPTYLFHLACLLFAFQPVWGQTDTCNYVIQGAVYDQKTWQPLAYATVQLATVAEGAYTDTKGQFTFSDLCEKEYDLRVSYVGYKPIVHHHDFHHAFAKIYLAPEETVLQSVVVVGEYTASDLETGTATKISGDDLAAIKTESFGEVVICLPSVCTKILAWCVQPVRIYFNTRQLNTTLQLTYLRMY